MFISISRLLWAFHFNVIEGKEPDPGNISQGLVATPARFECDVVPREGRAEMVRRVWAEAKGALDENGQWKSFLQESLHE